MSTRASHEGPELGLKEVQRAWFHFNGSVYAVVDCADDVFKAFITQIAPDRGMKQDTRALLDQHTLDDMDRWFVLWSLSKATVPIPLYKDRDCAEIALRASTEALKKRKAQLHAKKRARPSKRVCSAVVIAS